MIALNHKDTGQKNSEAPIKCLRSKVFPCDLHYNGTSGEGFSKLGDSLLAHPHGNATELNLSLSRDSLEFQKESQKWPIYHHNLGSWAAFYPVSSNMPPRQLNASEDQFHRFSVNHRFQYTPSNAFPQNYPYDYQIQDFQYFIVIDFEATCDREKIPHPQEIIEFPSVIVNSLTGQLEACFQSYVRPTCNQLLSEFCKDLTGIQQIQVDRGVTLSEALLSHDEWLEKKGIKNTNFAVVTWSNWDCQVMLESECQYKNLKKPPYFNRWINLKVPFHEVFGGVRCNLKKAVEMAGLAWQGRAHCGLDDAKNTAMLLTLLMRKGIKFSITNSIMSQSTDDSFTRKLPPQNLPFVSPQPHKSRDLQFQAAQYHPYCHCGVKSSKAMVRKPGPKQGNLFFGCGNWTAARGALCHYFEWISPS
ncbi:unnamed protein product [Fraxinus pennsylvanica]|uniref:GRF-type domain-containing protein n=1 Tax=Fraxinus pennsylvanica TaxID=56036 RepID=A0AAD2EFL7_9LAMI|nr:unnamed protein product [Fraxinus pennsylvanica]